VIDWKSQGKSGNFVLEDLYEPCSGIFLLGTYGRWSHNQF